jgi:small subunit ribosomal protein S9
MEKENITYATGKRKTSVARTWLMPGKGQIMVNNRLLEDYFYVPSARAAVKSPLMLTHSMDNFDIRIKVSGGGLSGQAGAIRHGITRALIRFNPDFRTVLKKAGYVKRDPRAKERKKYGQKGARARFQFSKR